jgi:hypothetical protein
MKRTLRTLVVAEIILTISGVALELATEGWLPDALQAYQREVDGAELTPREWVLLPIVLALLGLTIAAWTTIWVGWRHARWLYTITTSVGLLLTAAWGPYVRTGIAEGVQIAAYMVAGMILGILHFGMVQDSRFAMRDSRFGTSDSGSAVRD